MLRFFETSFCGKTLSTVPSLPPVTDRINVFLEYRKGLHRLSFIHATDSLHVGADVSPLLARPTRIIAHPITSDTLAVLLNSN